MTTTRTDEKHVGRYYGERRVEITPELVAHYANAVQDHNPWYFGDSPFGGPVAPALILHSEVYTTIDWYLSYFGNLHARQEWEIFAPIMVGDTVTTRRQIVERYHKRDREYVVMEVGCFAEDGRLLNRGRTHQSFLDRPTEREMEVLALVQGGLADSQVADRLEISEHEVEFALVQLLRKLRLGTREDVIAWRPGDKGAVVVDKDREKRTDRKFDVEQATVIETIAGPEKDISIEMCQLFSGPNKNYHNDVEEARKLGFPDIVVQGMMSLCFVSQMMIDRFGEGWWAGGKMNVNLVNVLWQGEHVTARGQLTEETSEGSRKRAQAQVWCDKADGTKIVIGTASAISG